MTGSPDVWGSFSHDPRDPAHASLRAADIDREVVHQVLTEAYADGRLDRQEFDTRTSDVANARTLGDLVPALDGLVPAAGVPARGPASRALASTDLEQRAVQKWRDERRSAITGFVIASVICWVIWTAMNHGFPWPIFVMLGTGMNAFNTHSQRESIVARERRRLEKKQRKELDQRRDPQEGDA